MAVIKEVLFNDGEGLDYTDLNNVQRFLRAQLSDFVVGHLGRTTDGVTTGWTRSGTADLHAFGDSAAPYASGTNLTINCVGGVIAQKVTSTATGSDPDWLMYYATAAELTTLHTATSGSGARWDLVSIQLTHANADTESRDFEDATTRAKSTTTPSKRRNVVMTKTTTQGTPAGSPTIPATPAGHVPLYAVYIPASHSGTLSNANIFDYRYPFGSFCVDVYAVDMYRRTAYGGSPSVGGTGGAFGYIEATSSSDYVIFTPSGIKANAARLIGLEAVSGDATGSSTYSLKRFTSLSYGLDASATALGSLGSDLLAMEAAGSAEHMSMGIHHHGLVQGVAGPVWANGYGAGYANSPANLTAPNEFARVGVTWDAGGNNDRIVMMRFHFAGGT